MVVGECERASALADTTTGLGLNLGLGVSGSVVMDICTPFVVAAAVCIAERRVQGESGAVGTKACAVGRMQL
jgi:hypothetical protein